MRLLEWIGSASNLFVGLAILVTLMEIIMRLVNGAVDGLEKLKNLVNTRRSHHGQSTER